MANTQIHQSLARRLEDACRDVPHAMTMVIAALRETGLAHQAACAWLERRCPRALRIVQRHVLSQSVEKSKSSASNLVRLCLDQAVGSRNDR